MDRRARRCLPVAAELLVDAPRLGGRELRQRAREIERPRSRRAARRGSPSALNAMRHSRWSRVSSKVELVSKLRDHGFQSGVQVESREVADGGARRSFGRLLVILEPHRKLAVRRCCGRTWRRRYRRRGRRAGSRPWRTRAAHRRRTARCDRSPRRSACTSAGAARGRSGVDVPAVARLDRLRLHAPVVVHEADVERERVAVERIAPLGE